MNRLTPTSFRLNDMKLAGDRKQDVCGHADKMKEPLIRGTNGACKDEKRPKKGSQLLRREAEEGGLTSSSWLPFDMGAFWERKKSRKRAGIDPIVYISTGGRHKPCKHG